jgi:phosphoglycolate phosphatase-like HAD superfamily hydrolase
MSKTQLTLLLGIILFISSCNQEKATVPMAVVAVDALPSWNQGATKSAIVDFVEDVTDPSSPNFVPPADRIATFDNDGNLWSEQPMYFQLIFALDRVKALAPDHPEWQEQQPFKAVLENDRATLLESGEHGILELVMATHAGMTPDGFQQTVQEWLETARHPRFDQPFNNMIYQPMLELLEYLRAHDFKTFIVSGGGVEFMRAWVEEAYGIPPEQVVGSSVKTEFVMEDGKASIRRLPEIDFIDDKAGKPVGINKFVGKRPILASGNSDGDLQMLQYTASGDGPKLMLYLHHTDSVREWAYDRDSHIGRLDQGLDEAAEHGWTVIDMAKDWKTIYPFQENNNQ